MPNMDHGLLPKALERWRREGLNPDLDPHRFDEWCDAFGLDRYYFCVGVSFENCLIYLRLRHEILGLGSAPPDRSRVQRRTP